MVGVVASVAVESPVTDCTRHCEEILGSPSIVLLHSKGFSCCRCSSEVYGVWCVAGNFVGKET